MSTKKDQAEQRRRDSDPHLKRANELENLKVYARSIAIALSQTHYPENHGRFVPYEDLFGLLEQIDNMMSGLERKKIDQPRPDNWLTGGTVDVFQLPDGNISLHLCKADGEKHVVNLDKDSSDEMLKLVTIRLKLK